MQGQIDVATGGAGGSGDGNTEAEIAALQQQLKEIAGGWHCFLESDIYFIPENFRRYVWSRKFDVSNERANSPKAKGKKHWLTSDR